MSDIPLEAFIRSVARVASERFDKDGCHEPIFIGDDAQGARIVFPVGELMNTKNAAALAMRQIAKEAALVRCVLINEAWVLSTTLDPAQPRPTIADFDRAHPEGLEYVPGRREELILQAEDYVNGSLIAWREIIRPDGRKPYLGPLRIDRFNETQGRFVSFLPPRGTKQ